MTASTTAMASSTSVYNAPAFWERLWRTSGIQFVVLFIIAYIIYGYQPQVGAPADALVAFYDGHRTRILIAVFFFGLNLPTSCGSRRRSGPPWLMLGETVGARRPPPPAQRSERCSSWRLRWARPSPTPSPTPEIPRSHRD